ncbi:radical SAM protein [Carboxydocella sp. JDF658]|uniref:radical SAM protein n=1 Tax=Carboxydocella sp. JDF658 TaxID=1926600 RepID=UPI0009AD6CAA|nr:radical SAM protein [Carboxydocella sp. JDF658]GAW30329.1 radical SAM protein [Carboxydocella sp. JDF658]
MGYVGAIFRPPSEADSLILQVTVGCSHNHCTFCTMYKDKKFALKPVAEIKEDLLSATQWPYFRRVFLADGDALAAPTDYLLNILELIQTLHPQVNRVGIYASPKSILTKSVQELHLLKEKGLGIAYLGLESGSDLILKKINKGVDSQAMIDAAEKVKAAGLLLSVTIINGLGGKGLWQEHAQATARVLTAMQPHYLGALTLMLDPAAPLYQEVLQGTFQPIDERTLLAELELLLSQVELENCIFRSNHASNLFVLKGTLNRDRDHLLAQIRQAPEQIQRFGWIPRL